MSSLRNAVYRRAHKERSQPQSRKKYGLLEKHKDYVGRVKAFHKKEDALRKLREKAAFRNPDEFYFKMIKTKTVDGVHKPESQANKYTQEELMLMKTQDIGYVLQKLQSEKNKIEKLTAVLQSLDNQPSTRHVFYAEDREDAKEMQLGTSKVGKVPVFEDVPDQIKRKTAASYRELGARKVRVNDLEKLHMDMAMQKELQKRGGNANFVKMRLYVQPPNQYTSGGQTENDEGGSISQCLVGFVVPIYFTKLIIELGVGAGRLRLRNFQSVIRLPDWRIGENQSASVHQSGGCGLSGLADGCELVWRFEIL